ncbi:MAG: aldo/keto reductase, partial [Clostridia bacterium]
KYRQLGKTGLRVSEIGLGGEWLERHTMAEVQAVIDRCDAYGINLLDCWMSNPKVRGNIGAAIEDKRGRWIVQGHIGSTWQNGQYVRTREIKAVKAAFEDLLAQFRTDYIDLGMIHFVDSVKEFEEILQGEFMRYVRALKAAGTIRYIGLSSHNPAVAQMAALCGEIDVLLFSLNPAFDMLPANEKMDVMFGEEAFQDPSLGGISAERDNLYRTCAREGIAITVMKGYAGGRLFSAEASPFSVALTPVQCLHYALTRPAVASVMVGFDTPEHVDAAVAYETATESQKDYASVLATAPKHAYAGQCTYCGHCAPCPSKIDIAMVNKLYDLAVMQREVPASIRAHYQCLSANASHCVSCGACEKRCPFGVAIVERMKNTAKLFG